MKPLTLEFEGINSFSEHTIIDFGDLTKNGIFGIFGDTGSGKSTILDCINFALYGNVERSKEKIDIINYKCDSAKVKFVFNIVNGGKRKVYTVERQIKKDKSGTHKAFLYENDGESELCIADKASQVERKIVEILGVEAEDFRKCIALPQGEFSQFVKSAPRERLQLIERLFSLSKYGDKLKEKLSYRQSKNELKYQNAAGRFFSYEGVTEDLIKEKSEQLSKGLKEYEEVKKQSVIYSEKCEELRNLNKKRNELIETEKQLEILNGERQRIEELKNAVKILPVCREIVKTDNDLQNKKGEREVFLKDISELSQKSKIESDNVLQLEKTLKEGNYEEKISECAAKATLFSSCQGKSDKLKEINRLLEVKRKDYKNKEEEYSRLVKKFENINAELEKAQTALKECIDRDFEHLIKTEFKGAVLKEEYVSQLGYFTELKSGIRIYGDKSPLYDYVFNEVSSKIEEYKQRIDDCRDFSLARVNESLDKLEENKKESEKRQIAVNELSEELHRTKSKIEIKQKELDVLLNEGKDLKARSVEIDVELKTVFGENYGDFASAERANEQKSKVLKTERENLLREIEKSKSLVNSHNVSIERLNTLLGSTEKDISLLSDKLSELVKDNRTGVEQSKLLCIRFEEFANAEKVISEFETQCAYLTAKRQELLKTERITEVDGDILKEAETKSEELTKRAEIINADNAVLSSEIASLKIKLKEKAEINKELELVEKERNLLSKLKEVTKNNKFLEYIANEYLLEISSLASSMLLDLMDGRYFLTYKDGNFYVGDNFNCGTLRGVNTLSGGETFLVSLSLALALSRTICARSMKSIEFFFLDEGFGTLDSTLVDVVMNALEKLKSSSYTIGVISHVEELKHRIDNKIIVNKANETHGSTVSVSL